MLGGIYIMAKDSQPDNKQARMEKCNYQTPITEEGHNHNPNLKHKSVKREGVSSNLQSSWKLIKESQFRLSFINYSLYACLKDIFPNVEI